MKRLSIDYEFSSRSWWENGGQEMWDALTEGFDRGGIVVDEHLATSWLAQAEKISGWNDGAEYAPHPISLGEVDEDDEEFQ